MAKLYRKLHKKGVSQAVTIWGVAIFLAVVVIGSVAWITKSTPAPASSTNVQVTGGGSGSSSPQVAAVACPSGSSTNIKDQYEDTTASTATFASNIIAYAILKQGGSGAQSFVTLANTSATSQAYSSATAVQCNTLNPVVYNIYAVAHKKGDTTAYGYTSAVGYVKPDTASTDVTSAGDTIFVDFKGQRTDLIKVTIKDKNNQDKYLNSTSGKSGGPGQGTATAQGTTGYSVLNDTFTDQGGQTSLTIAQDGYFDLEISAKSNNTRNVLGEVDPRTGKATTVLRNSNYQIVKTGTQGAISHSLRTLVAIDADASDWQEPLVSGGGITKIDKSDLAPDDQTVLSSYEFFYTVNQLKDIDTIFRWYMQSKSGVNPSMDPKWRFCAEGIYSSSDESGVLKIGCFDDGASNLENHAPSGQQDKHEITVNIS